MIGNLDGLIAFLVFIVMGGIALLMIIVGLIIKLAGNHRLFLKFAMVSILFFITGLLGFTITVYADSSGFAKIMDEYVCGPLFLIDIILAVFIFLKKATPKV